jgi:hypothetical protein
MHVRTQRFVTVELLQRAEVELAFGTVVVLWGILLVRPHLLLCVKGRGTVFVGTFDLLDWLEAGGHGFCV